ncbi:LapA family protein [Paracoccus sp. Z330]|uniref:LapA family protein n=1 Tax=Paracoccus onchidii TaxID=3017813 RepID=A0ABT4ZF36_9RHOB|nr:LapA family protein [Paracoccus onchidii]MDB6177969.1 LapA family protein [Paracoccus onchidii]
MRFIRLLFLALLAILLVAVALANRDVVTLSAFPANFGQYLGGDWSISLPLFLVIFVAFALGMLAGLVWEYLREAHIRREARQRSAQIARLEGEVGHLRDRHAAPRDEVVAILDTPRAPKAGTTPAAGSTLPAPR